MKIVPKPLGRFVLLKHWAYEHGLPYGSLRDACARGEFPVLRLGREDGRRARLYVSRDEMEVWVQRRLERAS